MSNPHNRALLQGTQATAAQQQGVFFTLSSLSGPTVRPPEPDLSVITRQRSREQEMGNDPLPVLQAGVQGPNVRPPTDVRTVVPQEQPYHPSPRWSHGVQGPDVHPPFSDSYVSTRQHFRENERAEDPPPFYQPGVQGPNVRSPTRDVVVVPQLAPVPWLLPYVLESLQGPNVETKVTDFVALVQRLPDHPFPYTRVGLVTNIRPTEDRAATLFQLPDHPLPRAAAGPQGPNVRPPVLDVVYVAQRQPDYLVPRVDAGTAGFPAQPVSPAAQRAVTRQERPDFLEPVAATGPSGAQVASGVVSAAYVAQRQPDYLLPQAYAGVQGPNVRPPTADTALTRQLLPDEAHFSANAGPPPPPPIPAVLGRIQVSLQEVLLLEPIAQPGTPPTPAQPGQGNVLVIYQRIPDHPSGALSVPGVPGASVAPFAYYTILRKPEHPEPPLALLGPSFQSDNVRPPTDIVVLVGQQQPGEPTQSTAAGVPGPNVLSPPIPLATLPHQEIPYHPAPFVWVSPSSYGQNLRRVSFRFEYMRAPSVQGDSLEPS